MPSEVLFLQGAGEGAHAEDVKLVADLRSRLGEDYQVRYPAIANDGFVDYETWRSLIVQEAEQIGESAILVGHSVGASVLIRTFASRGPKPPVAALFLVAAPFWHDHEFWNWDEARLPADAAENYPSDVPLFLFHGEDDEVVPVSHLEMYANAFPRAIVQRLSGRDHQLNEDMTEVARDIVSLSSS